MEEFVTDLITEEPYPENTYILDIQEHSKKPCLVKTLYFCQDWCCFGLIISIVIALMIYLINFKYVNTVVLNSTG